MEPDKAKYLNLYHHALLSQNILGPGIRYGVWVQGCNQRCINCIAANSWSMEKNIYLHFETLRDIIIQKKLEHKIRGITISGGEPFLQSQQLMVLLGSLHSLGLDVMCYTGYHYENLVKNKIYQQFLSYIDILVDGPYVEEKNNNSLWRGSDNQRIIFLTDRYKTGFSDVVMEKKYRKLDIEIKDNHYFITGIPPKDFDLEQLGLF